MKPFQARLRRLIGPVLIAAIGLYAIRGSFGLGLWSGDIPGPGLYPLICGGVLVALCAGAIGVEILRRPPVPLPGEPTLWARLILYLVALLLFAALIEPLGFLPTSVLALIVAIRLGERRPWPQTLWISLASSTAIWLLFDRLLGVPLPMGLLEGLR